jgi:tetratricopeptide (TPR) repeat protein
MQYIWLGALTLLLAAPTMAHDSGSPAADLVSATDESVLSQFQAILRTRDEQAMCRNGLPLVAELNRRHPEKPEYGNASLIIQIDCAFRSPNPEAAKPLIARLNEVAGSGVAAPYALFLAERANDAPETMKWLRLAVETDAVRSMRPDQVFSAARVILRSPLRAELESLSFELTNSKGFGQLDPDVQAAFASYALDAVVKSGDLTQVDGLLPYNRSPFAIIDMLSIRVYEPIWPALERYAGDHLQKVSGAYVDWSLARLNQRPQDRDRLGAYASALQFAGRFEDLLALTGKWFDQPERNGRIDEGDGWAMNAQVMALDALGRSTEADKLFDRLAELPADANPWVVNFVINRADRLAELGRWQEAIAAIDLAKTVAATHGSGYAREDVAGVRTCILQKLGRTAESEQELVFVRAHASDAPGAAVSALMCAGHNDDAARMVAGILADETRRGSVLRDLQEPRFRVFGGGGDASKLPTMRQLVFARPELREVALRYIRQLPDNLVPPASLRIAGLQRSRRTG